MASALINVPARAKRGEIIEIKTLISHTMETGFRRTQLGALIPRDIIRRFACTYNGTEVFRKIGWSFRKERSSRYRVMSSSPMGTCAPSIS